MTKGRDEIVRRNNVTILGGEGQTMLFAHGFGCDQNMWRFVAPAFVEDYRVILFDYVGSGKSDVGAYDADRYATLNGYAQDVLDIIEALDLQEVIFVGHSVSSMVGLLAATREPDRFANLVMIGPSPCYINDAGYTGGFDRTDIEGLLQMMEKNYIGWASFLAPVVMKNSERPELAGELEESFCSTDPVIAKRFAEATFLSDNRSDLSKVDVPALVLQCSDDMIAPESVGRFVHQNLKGSHFALMKATGHCPQMSHPDETALLIKNYLSG